MSQDTVSNTPIKQEIIVKTEECIEISIEAVKECLIKEPVSVKIEPMSIDEDTTPVDANTSQVQVKKEIVYVKEEPRWTGAEGDESEDSPQATLYAGHVVKPDLVVGTESLQPQDAAFNKVSLRAKSHGAREERRLRKGSVPNQDVVKDPEPVYRSDSNGNEEQNSDEVSVPTPGGTGKILSYATYGPRKFRKLPSNIDYSPDLFICDTCYLQFTTKTRLIKHISLHKYKNTKQYYCDICDKSFAYYTYKSTHLKLHTGVKPYTCKICEKSFAFQSYLNAHKRIHTGERPHACGVCKKTFKTKSQMLIHAMRHEGGKAKIFQCPTCPMKFAYRYKLVLHERVHTKEMPYVCDICHKGYTQKGKLGQHLRVHTKQNPFVCKICQKIFVSKIDLERHDRIHTGYKPYSCDVCGSSFSQSAHLKSHKITHTGEKPYKCDVCPKEFTSKFGLKKHKLTHTGEDNSLVCKNCNKQFMVWGRWKRHESKCPVGGKKRIRSKKTPK